MKILKFLVVLFVLLLPFGQLGRVTLGQLNGVFYIHDFVLLALLLGFVLFFLLSKRNIILPVGSIPLIFFILFATASLVNSFNLFSGDNVFSGSLFLVRFILYSSLYVVVFNLIEKEEIKLILEVFLLASLVISLLGFLQFIFFYDLSFLSDYGWDPHIGRLVSTFFDPNFLGGYLVFSFSISLALYVFKTLPSFLIITPLVYFIAIILTFSRSAYLSWIVSVLLFGFFRSKKLLLLFIPIFAFTIFLLPRAQERISGAAQIDVTAQARINSWQNALEITSKNLFLGVGFNNYRQAQAQHGYFTVNNPEGGFSGAGADSSLLLVLATTGVLGFFLILRFSFESSLFFL